MCFPPVHVNFPIILGAFFMHDIYEQPPLNVLYFMISQKRKQTVNQKETHVHP